MRKYGLVLSILLLIASFISALPVDALVTGASLSATQTGGTFTGDFKLNRWGQGHDWQGTGRQGHYKVESESWDPSSPPCLVRIELAITYDDTGNVGGTIDGSIHGTAAMRAEPGVRVGNWDKGAPRPFDGEQVLVLHTNERYFPERQPHLAGTYSHYKAGTFEWSATGEAIAQRAYDLKISTTTTERTVTTEAEVGRIATVGVGVSKTTGKTQGVDWDFGQSVSLSVDASPPGESPVKPVKGQWVVIKEYELVKKCIACSRDVSDKFEHYRSWRGGVWICQSDGYYSNKDLFSAYDTYEAVVFHSEKIHKVYWVLQKPGWDEGRLSGISFGGGLTESYSLSLGSKPGTYKVVAQVYYGKRNNDGRYPMRTYIHNFYVH